MMGFLGAGNNPMVGMTVSVAVAVEESLKYQIRNVFASMGKVATCHRQVAGISIRNALHCSPMVGMTVDLAVAVEEGLKG